MDDRRYLLPRKLKMTSTSKSEETDLEDIKIDDAAREENIPLKEIEEDKKEKENVDNAKISPGEAEPLAPSFKEPKNKKPFDLFENKWLLLLIILVVLLSIIVVIIAVVATRKPVKRDPKMIIVEPLPPAAVTFCGLVIGTEVSGSFVFKGIPYAQPASQTSVWEPTRPIDSLETCWEKNYNATFDRPTCPHMGATVPTSEDCFYINIWTPSLNETAALPVMVYISADDQTFLNGVDSIYTPSAKLAKELNVVFVSFNYRGLSAFEFHLAHILNGNEPGTHTVTAGNYGIMDQIEALHWVQRNIQGFGGDKNKVTIFGVGSGAASVLGLLTAPSAKGLFHRAWITSGISDISTTANQINDKYTGINFTPCAEKWEKSSRQEALDCLRGLTTQQILNADRLTGNMYKKLDNSSLYQLPQQSEYWPPRIVIDGFIVPDTTEVLIADLVGSDVPLLIGSMGEEIQYFQNSTSLKTWEEFDLIVTQRLQELLGTPSGYKNYYKQEVSPTFQMVKLVSDIRVNCPLNRLATLASQKFSSPVYRYVVSQTASDYAVASEFMPQRWAFHGYDLAAFFGQFTEAFDTGLKLNNIDIEDTSLTNVDLEFQKFIRNLVKNFVLNGEIESWMSYQDGNTTAVYDLIASEVKIAQPYAKEKCEFWRENGMLKYGWKY